MAEQQHKSAYGATGTEVYAPLLSFRIPASAAKAAMGLVIILSQQHSIPVFIVHASLAIPGLKDIGTVVEAAGARRESAVAKGAAIARKLLPQGNYSPWLAADISDSPFGGPLALVVLPLFADKAASSVISHLAAEIITEPERFEAWAAPSATGWAACSWKVLASSPLAEACAVALMAVEVLLRRPRPEPEPPPTGAFSADAGTGRDRWNLLHHLHDKIQGRVRRALTGAGGKVAEYADRVHGSGFVDAPTSLQVHDHGAMDEAWAHELFSPVLLPPVTQPLPPAAPQPHTSFRPTRVRDLLLPAAHTRLIQWLRANAKDIQDMLTNGSASERPYKPRPLVLGQADFAPEARGRVWDLRGAARGVITPLDFTAAPVHDLNVEQLRYLLGDCPDKELIDHLIRGVDFKAELPLQAVLLPHMTSLAPHVALVEREIERLVDCKWHEVFKTVPFLPLRLNPNGAVVRKLEQLRPRRVENASADGCRGGRPLVDSDGVPVRSLNEAVGIQAELPDASDQEPGGADTPGDNYEPQTERKWPKETKPSVLNKVHDLAVLRYAARVFDEDLVGFVVDFKDYFNNFPVNARYLWVNICHWRSMLGIGGEELGCFVSELRLGFGVSAASNVCQRFAHALAEIFRTAFDKEEEVFLQSETDEKRRAYLQQRRHLGPNQCRLYEISIYTDDPFFACVGINRLVRALRLWHRITDDIKLELAVVTKRQCGAELSWLGVQFLLTAGAHFITPNKRLRALREVSRIVAAEETVSFAEYRTITSFLQYLKPLVLHLKGDSMYHLYGPYRRRSDGSLPGAGDTVRPNEAAIGCLERWIDILSGACAAFFSATLSRQPLEQRPEFIHLYSDAALEVSEGDSTEEDQSGMGGYCEGLFWHLPLVGCARRLPITVLEFIAIGINMIIFAKLLRKARSVLCSDSLSSVHVLNSFSARGELMQYTHRAVLALPEYKALCSDSYVVHCYGPANPCADAASRHQIARLQRVCAHLGIVPECMEVPAAAHELLLQVCSFAESHGLLTNGPQRRRHSTSIDLKAAAQVANGFGHRGHDEEAVARLELARPRVAAAIPSRSCSSSRPTQPPTPRSPSCTARHRPFYRHHERSWDQGTSELAGVHLSEPGQNKVRRPSVTAQPRTGPERGLHISPRAKAHATGRGCAVNPAAPSEAHESLDVRTTTARAQCSNAGGGTFDSVGRRDKRTTQDISAGESARVRKCIRPEVAPPQQTTRQLSTARARGQQRLACATMARATELASKLASDTSPLALRPPDPARLETLCEAFIAATQTVHATGTLDVDGTAWRRWEAYCQDMGTPPVRSADGASAFADSVAIDRETILQSGFLIHLATVVEPRAKASPAAKPQSLFNNLLAVRRVHQRLNIDFRICKGAGLTLKAQIRRFVLENGPEALMPARKEPLDANSLRRVLRVASGISIGRRLLDWNNYFFISFKAMLCTGLAAAFRKAELCLPDGASFTLGQLSISSVSWVIGGTAVASTAHDHLAHLQVGDFCVIKPPICKNDPFALHFGTKPIWLPINDDPINAARAIAAMFLADRTPAQCPERTPLFRASSTGDAIRHGEADATFRDLIAAAFPTADPNRWSLHSLRIGAACALLAAQASHALIQAVCRWRSTKSVDIYARLGPTDYARFVHTIEQQAVDAVTTQRVHEIRLDYDDIVATLNGPRLDIDEAA